MFILAFYEIIYYEVLILPTLLILMKMNTFVDEQAKLMQTILPNLPSDIRHVILPFLVSVTPGERTSNRLSPLVSVGVRSLSGEPVPCPLMSVLPVGVR